METAAGTTAPAGKGVREGSAQKRSAILRAARDLFVADGFDRTSVDAVAIRARVSKRTVYDYYGDKRTLLLSVVVDAGESLLESFVHAIEDHLSNSAHVSTIDELESALVAFAEQIMNSTIGSSDYAAIVKLVMMDGERLPELQDHPLANAPENAIAERIGHFAAAGILDAPNPRLAADHFGALTFHLAFDNAAALSGRDTPDRESTILEGVRAFLRAYARR